MITDYRSVSFPSRKKIFLLSVGFLILALVTYWPSLFGEFVFWDDDILIFENPVVWSISPWTLWKIFTMYDPELYIPLTFFSYQINYLLGGISPWIYHATNLLFHAGTSLLVSGVALFLSRGNRRVALLVGLLFLLHPLQTEAVAWISARKDILATFFFFLSLLLFLMQDEHASRHVYVLSVVCFLLALLSKVVAVTLPTIILLIVWYRRGGVTKDDLWKIIPYFSLSVVFGIIAIAGKPGQIGASSVSEFMLMASKSTVFYLTKILAPVHLSVIYPFDEAIALSNPDILLSCSLVIALVVGCVLLVRKWRLPLFSLLFFLVTLAPTFINYRRGFNAEDVYFASDRYVYISSFVIFFLIASLLVWLMKRYVKLGIMITSLVIVTLFTLSFQQSKVWKSSFDLFTHTLSLYPSSHVIHNNLATVYYKAGMLEEAEEHYLSALNQRALASTYSNLATLYRRQGHLDKSLATFQQALQINPVEYDAYFGMGILLTQAGKLAESEAAYKRAIAIDASKASSPLNLGALYAQSERYEDAVREYLHALEINPFYANAYFNLGVAYKRLGRVDEARTAFLDALQYRPDMEPARTQLEKLQL